jgi:hypothetical protein
VSTTSFAKTVGAAGVVRGGRAPFFIDQVLFVLIVTWAPAEKQKRTDNIKKRFFIERVG